MLKTSLIVFLIISLRATGQKSHPIHHDLFCGVLCWWSTVELLSLPSSFKIVIRKPWRINPFKITWVSLSMVTWGYQRLSRFKPRRLSLFFYFLFFSFLFFSFFVFYSSFLLIFIYFSVWSNSGFLAVSQWVAGHSIVNGVLFLVKLKQDKITKQKKRKEKKSNKVL
jgi:hypothetical protein